MFRLGRAEAHAELLEKKQSSASCGETREEEACRADVLAVEKAAQTHEANAEASIAWLSERLKKVTGSTQGGKDADPGEVEIRSEHKGHVDLKAGVLALFMHASTFARHCGLGQAKPGQPSQNG